MSQLSTDWIKRLGEPYLPGAAREPPRGVFDDIKTTIPARVDAEVLLTAPALKLATELYGARYFWEAQDVLEALSQASLPNSQPRHLLQALIHIANACLKLRVQQPNAALRLVRDSENRMTQARGIALDIDIDGFLEACTAMREPVLAGDTGAALADRPLLRRRMIEPQA